MKPLYTYDTLSRASFAPPWELKSDDLSSCLFFLVFYSLVDLLYTKKPQVAKIYTTYPVCYIF